MIHYLRVLGVLLLLRIPAWGLYTEKKYQRPLSRFSLAASGGLTQFFGELHEQDFKGILTAGVGYEMQEQWHLYLGISKGQLGGLERHHFQSVFESRFHQVDLLVKYNCIKKQKSWHDEKPFHFGLLAGLGLMRFHSEAYDANTGELLRFTNSANSARNPLFVRWGTPRGDRRGIRYTNERAVPVGIWMNMPVSRNLQAGVELRYYFVRTDKLDATSGMRTVNPEEGESYSDTPNDKYSFAAFTVTYRFLKNVHRGKAGNSRK